MHSNSSLKFRQHDANASGMVWNFTDGRRSLRHQPPRGNRPDRPAAASAFHQWQKVKACCEHSTRKERVKIHLFMKLPYCSSLLCGMAPR
jgi:hypothetical protein